MQLLRQLLKDPSSHFVSRLRFSALEPQASEQADPLVGTVAAGLEVERLLAEGGIGQVYVAKAPPFAKRLALKVLRPDLAGDAGMEARFAREIAFGCRVTHPNVVAVRGSGRLADGRPFFVMDLLEGTTLGELLCREGPLAVDRALAIVDQLLAGLEALHAARIVHRDLQPDNIFITREADGHERVLLLDLGFAHEPGVDTGDGVTGDSPGALVGTMAFLAPEQVTRCRAITERSDLFVAGLVLYFALSGKLPFRGSGGPEGLISVLRSAPMPLRRARQDLPASLEPILGRAFAKHPDARFSGALEMREALRRAAASR